MNGYLGGHRARERRARAPARAVVPVMIAAGLLFGTGLGSATMSTPDGLTWLGDAARGEAVQVNPVTGRQENRLKVAPAGNQIDLAQRDGLLVVIDETTGTLTVIDASALVTGGRWFGSGGGAVEVLLNKDQLYVVDRVRGLVQRLDPLSARTLGAAWSAGGLIADAALDGMNTLWALRGDGRLSSLAWAPGAKALTDTRPPVQVKAAGLRSLVIPHGQGVTVVASEAGVVSRIGTGDDTFVEIPPVPGKINPAPEAPSDLVPVSAADSGKVLLLHRGRAITIDTSGMGCARPGQPVVFHGRVYVGCEGGQKVLVLGRDGERRPDIRIPAGSPKLTIDDGKLFIHVDGADTGSLQETSRTGFRGEAAFNPPFAWRTFEGACTLNYAGPVTGSRPVNCWATSLSFTFTGGLGYHRLWLQAGTVRSNEVQVYGYHEPPEPQCRPRCQIP